MEEDMKEQDSEEEERRTYQTAFTMPI